MSKAKLTDVSEHAGNPHVRFVKGGGGMYKYPLFRTLSFLALGAVMAASAPTFAVSVRYASSVWSMGNYNQAKPQSFTAATTSPRLAFKGMSLSELSDRLDGGYTIFAEVIGYGAGSVRGKLASFYNRRNYPTSGTPEKIFGDFCIFDSTSPGYLKAVCVEFTGETGGVYVTALRPLYKQTATINDQDTDFMEVSSGGTVTYKSNYTQLYETNNIATEWRNGTYGVATLQLAKFVGSGSPSLVLPGATVDGIKGYAIAGTLGGRSAGEGLPCTAYNRSVVEDGGVATEMTVEMQAASGTTNLCVVLRLTDGDGGVHAEALAARSASVATLGTAFSNGDGTYNGTAQAISTGYDGDGYGVYGLSATKEAVYATSHDVVTSTTALVWPGITLDDVTNCWLGCRFAGNAITAANRGFEGRGCNPRITRDANGSATKISVEYQVYDNNNTYIKCTLVDLTNGADGGVYATKVGTGFLQTTTEKVGWDFGDVSGSLAYDVYDLCAVPCIVLETDEDWSPHGRLALGDAVVDLNGHSLTAGELAFDTTRTGMVVNTATSTTAEFRAYVFEGGTVTNDSVNVGNTCISTENIKFVKDGKGVYYAAKPLEYAGGTEIAGGTVKPKKRTSNGTDAIFGNSAGAVTVASGAVLDWNGQWNFCNYGAFVLDGGTMQHTGTTDFTASSALLKNITLASDSTFTVARSWGLINLGYAAVALDHGGHTLGIAIGSGKMMFFNNVRASGAGRIEATGDGTLQVKSSGSSGFGFDAPEVDLRAECGLDLEGAASVHDYEAAGTNDRTGTLGSQPLNVYGTFRPETRYFRGCTMQDGSTMDFSSWPTAAGWPVASAYTCSGEKAIRFADGDDVTVTVKLGGRTASVNTPIVAWDDDNRPDFTKVKFVRDDSENGYALVKKNNGLYVSRGLLVIVR